jgi:hypothetical protein
VEVELLLTVPCLPKCKRSGPEGTALMLLPTRHQPQSRQRPPRPHPRTPLLESAAAWFQGKSTQPQLSPPKQTRKTPQSECFTERNNAAFAHRLHPTPSPDAMPPLWRLLRSNLSPQVRAPQDVYSERARHQPRRRGQQHVLCHSGDFTREV